MRVPLLILALAPTAALAEKIDFADGWREQRLSLFSSNDYDFGEELGIVSDGTVSLAWRPLGEAQWGASAASWTWTVDETVPATDLSLKGGDDRNISVYFVYLPAETAREMAGAGARELLGNEDVRILQYAWGGDHAQGEIIPSPYTPGQGVTIPLRPAGTGSHAEAVDLAADYRAAFDADPPALVGLAVSADSDDTETSVKATLGPITLD